LHLVGHFYKNCWCKLLHSISSYSDIMFYDAVSCWDDMVSVTEDWMSMKHLWNETDRVKNRSHRRKICTALTLSSTNSTWSGLEVKMPVCGETVTQPTYVFHGLFTLLIYVDSDSSRYICIQKLPVWKIYSFCEEMLHHMWSRLSGISHKLIKNFKQVCYSNQKKKIPENFSL